MIVATRITCATCTSMNTNSCNMNLQTRIDAHKYRIMSIISIFSIRSLCIDSLTVIDICSSKFCMNKYICTYTYISSYLIICHISIYLCITALVYLCFCLINMHIYIYLYTAYLSQTFSNGVSTRPWAIWCVDFCLPCPWHHPHCSTYSGFFFAAPWFFKGDKSAAIPKNDQKPLGKSKETQNEDLFDLMCKCHVGLQHLEGSHDWLPRIQNSCNEYQAKNLQMPSI